MLYKDCTCLHHGVTGTCEEELIFDDGDGELAWTERTDNTGLTKEDDNG